jgi:hypothetical protein
MTRHPVVPTAASQGPTPGPLRSRVVSAARPAVGQGRSSPDLGGVSAHERWAGGRVGLQLAGTSAATSTCGTAGSDIDLTL